jgi:type IVB pilus formation R64 PilN family outer membrane protein
MTTQQNTISSAIHQRMSIIMPVFGLCAVLTLNGCAVTPMEVTEKYDTKQEIIIAARAQAVQQRATEAPFTIHKGNYLGGNVIALSAGASLPNQYRDVSHKEIRGLGNLQTVVINIRNLGLNVRVNPDVIQGTNQAASTAATAAGAQPAPGQPVAAPILLPLSFSGDLSDYLTHISGLLGVSWEYRAQSNEVHFYRMVTRTFSVLDVPGMIKFDDQMNGGGAGSAGSAGGTAGGGQTSTFGASSTSSITESGYEVWQPLIDSVKTVMTSAGKIAANKATGTIVITDTQEAADKAGSLIASEIAKMNQQVAVDVREIMVQLNDGNSIGLDLNMVYQQLNKITGSPDWAFKYGSPSNLSDGGSGSMSFNVARPQSNFNGSSIAAQALASFGKVVADKTDTLLTRNRVPGRFQRVTEQVYLASTTPASGSATGGGGGSGVPGLVPGVVSYGSTITMIPTIGDSNQVIMHLFDTQTDLLGINSVSTGVGATFQQINTPIVSRRKFAQSFTVQNGETLIIVGSESESLTSDTNAAFTGASNRAKRAKTMTVLMVTPRVMSGT